MIQITSQAVFRNQFTFFLDELKTVRVICREKGCGSVVEIPLELVEEKYRSGKCPVCQRALHPEQSNHIVELARAILGAVAAKEKYQIEFVLPVETTGGAA